MKLKPGIITPLRIALIVIPVLVAGLVIRSMWLSSHKDAPAPVTPHVIVTKPERGVVERTITLPGDLVGFYQAALYAKVTGYLNSISVDKGDWVKAGQKLAVIEVPELKEQLARAQADLQVAQVTYQRLASVWKSDHRLIARQDVDIAFGKYQEAKASVDQLNALFSYTTITAPFDGMITERFVDPGALIHAGGQQSATAPTQGSPRPGGSAAPVVSLARLDKLRIYVYVPQAETDFIRQGMPATVTVQGLKGVKFTGIVARFSHSLDLATRTMLTEVDLDNPEHKLFPGMYANVTLTLERHADTLRVPATALGGKDLDQVFVVRDDKLDKVKVKTGISDARHAEIVSGLSSDDLVVTVYSNALQRGEKVICEAISEAPPDVASSE